MEIVNNNLKTCKDTKHTETSYVLKKKITNGQRKNTHTLATRQPPKKLKNTTSVTRIMGSGPGAEPHAVHRLYVAAEGVTSIKKNMTLSLRVRERSGDNCRMRARERPSGN
ncbi:unnamed protein product [Boreogadus saida]